MVRFLLKLLLVKSGQQDGALLFCVARVKKRGGVFRGRGVNRKNTVIKGKKQGSGRGSGSGLLNQAFPHLCVG